MKKGLLYFIIFIMAIIIAVETTYIIIKYNNETKDSIQDKPEDKEQNNDPLINDGVKQKKVYTLNNIVFEEIEVTLNGKTKTMRITYSYDYDSDSSTHIITGTFNNIDIYSDFIKDDYTENNEIIKKYTKEEIYNTTNLKEHFKEENFIIIKGEDNKNYLSVIASLNDDSIDYNVYI